MASKIFMGDMPELMENILNNLNNEIYSLYSCALVSRHWCKISIPILWQDPFSFGQPLFVSKYFSSLDDDKKLTLKEFGINTEFSKTIFDYAKFLKVLDLSCLENTVYEWVDLELPYINNSLTNLIINLLFKIFIESGATLYKLHLDFSDFLEINPEIFNSLRQNEQFFSQLQNFFLKKISSFTIESATNLLRILAKNTTKISDLKLDKFYLGYEPQLFHALICIIKSQLQLRKFSLIGEEYLAEFYGIISALGSQTHSLQEIIVENCVFSTEFEVLKNCKQLEIFRIRYCDPKLLKISNYKIKTLEIADFRIDASTVIQVLEKSGILLQRLELESVGEGIREESLLLEALKSFCPNITYLNISNIVFSTQLVELICNLQKLQFLTLWCSVDIPVEELKIRVMQFAKIMPLTLQYLNLGDTWLEPYIDVLLNHCNTPLKKLLIYHLDNEKNTKALIKFCIRNNTLNYVGVNKYLNLKDHFRKEVETYVTLVPYESIVVNC